MQILVGRGASREKKCLNASFTTNKNEWIFNPLPLAPPPLPEVPLYKQKKKKFTNKDRVKLVETEETGEIVDLTKSEFSLWSFVADKVKAVWNKTKDYEDYAVGKYNAAKNYVVDKYNKVKGWFKSEIDATKAKTTAIKKNLSDRPNMERRL